MLYKRGRSGHFSPTAAHLLVPHVTSGSSRTCAILLSLDPWGTLCAFGALPWDNTPKKSDSSS
eukprot:4615733-Pyramimonas_sp.AAC.1